MNAKLRDIFNTLNALVTFNVDRSMSDDDFIANIDAINLLCNIYDDLGLDRSEIRRDMDKLYPQFFRRVYGKTDIQLAMPLIKALYRYIYGRGADNADRGPVNRRNAFIEMCCKTVVAYKAKPMMHSSDYLYALDIVSRMRDDFDCSASKEYSASVNAYLKNIDNVSNEEKIRRLKAYQDSVGHAASNDCDKWIETRECLRLIDFKPLDDDMFLIWCEVTNQAPLTELKRRSDHSIRMQVEYLQALTVSEFERQRRLTAKRKLNRNLRTLNDGLLGGIIDIKINANMSVSTLYALESIFYLRLQLAQVSLEKNKPMIETLCRKRLEQLAEALMEKYATADSINRKIEILERIEIITLILTNRHSDYALERASIMEDLPDLTYAQKLRLKWLPALTPGNESKIVAELLPQTDSSFEMATLALISDFCTDEERAAIFDRYLEMFDAALLANDTAELGNLLSLAAYWNNTPSMRPRLIEATDKAASIGSLSLSERRVNQIAAEIYAQIDTITGKYNELDGLTA